MSYRYLGNKTRIADWIAGIVAQAVPVGGVVADLMCGTASMSAAFARTGRRVIAADALRFPVLHARARLLTDTPARFAASGSTYPAVLAELDALPPRDGLFRREYGDGGRPANGARPRKYFTAVNAARIDAIRDAVRLRRERGLDGLACDLLLHDLILATNRVANIAGTYGFYRAGWSSSSLAPLRLIPTIAETVGTGHRILHGEAVDMVARIRADAVYLDPPYTKRQYAGNYHILETLALEDEPVPVGEGGLRDWSRQASDFCYRRRAATALRAVLDNCQARWMFVSYSEDGHLSDAELTDLLTGYGKLERFECEIDRFRSSVRVGREGAVRERLYRVEFLGAG